MRTATITGWGKCLPPAVLTNHDLEQLMDTSDEWITSRTGIKERRISHVPTSDLAAVAALRALAAAGRAPADVDMVIVATASPDVLIPSSASLVQRKIGAQGSGVMDINAACSGFIYGLQVADGLVRSGHHDTVLVIGAERLSFYLDFTNRGTAVLFGDGAGAVVVSASDEDAGLLASEVGANGDDAELLCVPGFGTSMDRLRLDPADLGVQMVGPEVFRRAVTMMGEASERVLAGAGLTVDEVDLLVPHQANIRIIDATARRLGLPPEKVFTNIASYGNTSAATIPIALTEAIEAGRISPGANLVFAAFGAGLTWAAGVLRWGARVEPIGTSDAELPPTDATALELLRPNIEFFGTEKPFPVEAGS